MTLQVPTAYLINHLGEDFVNDLPSDGVMVNGVYVLARRTKAGKVKKNVTVRCQAIELKELIGMQLTRAFLFNEMGVKLEPQIVDHDAVEQRAADDLRSRWRAEHHTQEVKDRLAFKA